MFDSWLPSSVKTQPPYDTIDISDTEYEIDMCLPGHDDVTISENDGIVTIKSPGVVEMRNYRHRGISYDPVDISIDITNGFRVNDAFRENGVLTIRFIKD